MVGVIQRIIEYLLSAGGRGLGSDKDTGLALEEIISSCIQPIFWADTVLSILAAMASKTKPLVS